MGEQGNSSSRSTLLTDDDVRAELAAFYERSIQRGFPLGRAAAMTAAFETGLKRDGHWAAVVLADLGLEPVRAYRRIEARKPSSNAPPLGCAGEAELSTLPGTNPKPTGREA